MSQNKPTTTHAAAGPGPVQVQARPEEASKRFSQGDDLFRQGDPGGDLLFIEDGVVEIYQVSGQETVVLAEMKAGEVIGVLTCLTRERRMASARAKTMVMCRQVSHDTVDKLMQTLPNWMKIVLKEFTLRLAQMNRLYGDALARTKALEQTQISPVYLASLIASSFATTAELMAISTEAGKIVIVEDILQKLEGMLNMDRADLDRIWRCMMQSNLLKIEIEPEKKKEMTRLENAQKLTFFAQFVKDSKHGTGRRLLKARFAYRETRMLSGLVRYAQRLDLDLAKVCRLTVKSVEEGIERKTGIKWEREAIQKGLDLKLLSLEGQEDQETLVFRPTELGRTVACVEVWHRLKELDLSAPPEDGDKSKKPAA